VHVGDEKVIQLKCGLKMTAVVRPALLWTLYPSTNIARLAAKCSLCSANLYDWKSVSENLNVYSLSLT